MSKILTILNNGDKDFRYYSSKGGASSPLVFGQKSIPYGMDRISGGYSKLPYIQKTKNAFHFTANKLTDLNVPNGTKLRIPSSVRFL